MKRLWLMTLVLLCLCASAAAEDVCTISGSALVSGIETTSSYVNITCPVDQPGQVLVSIYAPDGSLAWQGNYGEKSAAFTTDDIYLKLQGSSTTYTAVIAVGEKTYQFPIVRQMARLRGNAACTAGYPLSQMTGSDTWQCATIIHVAAMEGQRITAPITASGVYAFGTAAFTVQNGALTVTLDMAGGLDGSIDGVEIRVATDALTAGKLDSKRFSGMVGSPDRPINLNGAAYAAVYVKMTVSFDPATAAPGGPMNPSSEQTALWEQMKQNTANEAVG